MIMPTEPLLLQFDYLPVLEFRDGRSCVVGLAPTHAAIGFTDTQGAQLRVVCPPAMVSIQWSDEALAGHESVCSALGQSSLDVVHKLMFDFSHRPLSVLRGIWLAARGSEPPGLATYIRRLVVAIERGHERVVNSAPHLNATEVVRQQIEIAKHYNDHARLTRIEKGIEILREALELDAKTALSILSGEKRDFERERIATNGGNVETPFGRMFAVDTSRLKRKTYTDWQGKVVGDEVELTDDLLDGLEG